MYVCNIFAMMFDVHILKCLEKWFGDRAIEGTIGNYGAAEASTCARL